jgi:hypothetical protein
VLLVKKSPETRQNFRRASERPIIQVNSSHPEHSTVIMDLLGGNPENEEDDALLQQLLSASVLDAIRSAVMQGDLVNAKLQLQEDMEDVRPAKRDRNKFQRPASEEHNNCSWSKLYLGDESVKDKDSAIGKQFRTGFKVPHVRYAELYQVSVDRLGFSESRHDNAGRDVAPLELKVR